MVTPVLFTVSDGRIWIVLSRSSAKIGAIDRNAIVGLSVGRAIVQGEARVVDPLDPSSLVSSLGDAARSPAAAGSYLAGNLAHVRDLVGPGITTPRVMAAIRPLRALVAADGTELWMEGRWADDSADGDPDGSRRDGDGDSDVEVEVEGLPAALAGVTERHGPVVVGWTAMGGPLALPATWDPQGRTATIGAGVFAAAGCAPSGPACVLFDATDGTGLEDKTGVVLRGPAKATTTGAGTEITLATERISWWRGEEAATSRVEPERRPAGESTKP
jgi:hypothetical protein